ncbi:hypothetical protein Pmar_PMAR001382 [Perkinsus marinus ATCC 50983]|uniref:Uncharacterized protein n=1 Tax=Perkinsus marinus (strain ATCC 50983 / TXsc) TaxID=423536 RepID=C5KJJ8_PERM5|nr:hypothetical protein Pmar_PMAR001382 [Perkinsus marinus ATCC 50983]EER15332.1 hypothetical protein Pmar_PMAR001382 [Perkinsus marinus ATCC 50983]|eukprot:XP_002783536.1 hypothetical protein Pmar_PMAR001382 [Perkinsus marinus ATCC 50983]
MFAGFAVISLSSLALLSPADAAVPVTVAVTPFDRFTASNYSDLFEAGVRHLILAQNQILADGSIRIPGNWITVPLAEQIHGYAVKHNATVSLGLIPNFFIYNTSRSLPDFLASAQNTLGNYSADGLFFEAWIPTLIPTGDQWDVINSLTDLTRTKLKSRSGNPAIASLIFGADALSSSHWTDLKTYQPWKHTDRDYCLLHTQTVNFKEQISLDWAKTVADRLSDYSADMSKLSFTIVPEGRYDNLTSTKSYRQLIADGAPASGDGHFGNFYYNSQKQVKEKVQLVKTKRLGGMAVYSPGFDLPVKNTSSLLHAALSG